MGGAQSNRMACAMAAEKAEQGYHGAPAPIGTSSVLPRSTKDEFNACMDIVPSRGRTSVFLVIPPIPMSVVTTTFPLFALYPDGRFCGTTYYYRDLRA
jgi:hypothetical protein